jgi:hypothetical protein
MECSLPKLTFSKDLTRLAVSDDFGGVVKAMTNVDQNDLINVNHHHLCNVPSPKVCALRPGRFDSTH